MDSSVVLCLIYLSCMWGLDVAATQSEAGENRSGSAENKSTPSQKSNTQRPMITHVPELPASIAKPGRIENGTWLILFYTPWCEHSQHSLPLFLQTVKQLAETNMSGIYVGKLDISKDSGLGKHFKIRSTPTISLFTRSFRYDFEDDVSIDNLKKFVLRIVNATVERVNTTDQLSALQKVHPVVFLLIHDGEVDADWERLYTKAAKENVLKGTFFYSLNADILKSQRPSKFPALMVLKDDQAHQYREALSGYSLYRWILTERFTTFPTVTMATLGTYIQASKKLVLLVVHEEHTQRRIAQRKALEAVRKLAFSRKANKQYQFLLAEGSQVAELLLRKSVNDYPLLFVYDRYTGYHYTYQPDDKGFSEAALSEFLKLLSEAKLTPEGGPTYMDIVYHLYGMGNSLIQANLIHHPYVSMTAVFSLCGVIIFYIAVCFQNCTSKKVLRTSRARARKAALARRNNDSLRQRHTETHERVSESDESEEEEERSKDK